MKDKEPGYTPLIAAAHVGSRKTIVALLSGDAPADINAIDSYQNTALIIAAEFGHQEVVELLIESGANTTAINKCGRSAFLSAVWRNRLEVTKFLFAGGHFNSEDLATVLTWKYASPSIRFAKKKALEVSDVSGHKSYSSSRLMIYLLLHDRQSGADAIPNISTKRSRKQRDFYVDPALKPSQKKVGRLIPYSPFEVDKNMDLIRLCFFWQRATGSSSKGRGAHITKSDKMQVRLLLEKIKTTISNYSDIFLCLFPQKDNISARRRRWWCRPKAIERWRR